MKNATIVILAALATPAANAACEMPSLVASIPEGATATEVELLAAQAQVRAYIEAMDSYIACQNEEMATNGDDATSSYLYQMSERIEFARTEVDQVATEFNDQVEAFREARSATAAPLRETPARF